MSCGCRAPGAGGLASFIHSTSEPALKEREPTLNEWGARLPRPIGYPAAIGGSRMGIPRPPRRCGTSQGVKPTVPISNRSTTGRRARLFSRFRYD